MKNIFVASLFTLISVASYSQCVKGNCHRGHGTFLWEDGNKFDGYWVYSDYFNIPNLRKQSLELYANFIKIPSFKKVKISLSIYALLNLVFMSYIIYRIAFFIFSQHRLMYNFIINKNTSNISIINWLMFALSFILTYVLISKCVRIYKTYFYEK